MEMMEQIPRTLEVMIEAMDGRSMDRLVAAWDEWDAPTVQRPAIHRWLRNHPRTNPVSLIRVLRVEQLREICAALELNEEGNRQDLVRRVLLEALVDEEGLAPDSPSADRFREEILEMCDDSGDERVEIRPQDAAALPQPFLNQASSAPRGTPRGFDRVGGMEDLKALLRRDVIDAVSKPELYAKYGLTVPNGVLLHGPPGCGKTFIARALAEELDRPFFEVTPAAIASPYIHETARRLAEVYEKARADAPALVFLDELDALGPDRMEVFDFSHRLEEMAQLLMLLDNAGAQGVTTIGATNRLDALDPAIVRPGRFDHVIEVGLPDEEGVAAILSLELERRWTIDLLDVGALVRFLTGKTPAELVQAVDEAARRALSAGVPIDLAHFQFLTLA